MKITFRNKQKWILKSNDQWHFYSDIHGWLHQPAAVANPPCVIIEPLARINPDTPVCLLDPLIYKVTY